MKYSMVHRSLALIICASFLAACSIQPKETTEIITEALTKSTTAAVTTEIETTTQPPAPVVRKARINFVGDILPHTPVIRNADTGDDYDFTPCFSYVKDYISAADYSVCNLETTLAGAGQGRHSNYMYEGYSGYPTFNSPAAVARDLKTVGFDLLLNANNHSLDSFEQGIISTIDNIEAVGLEHTGTRKQESDKNYLLKNIKDIDFAFINFTYGMNGFNLSADKEYMVNHFNNYDDDYIKKMINDVKDMVAQNADVNVVCLHFGVEYGLYPDEKTQKEIAEKLFAAGIDIIIGDHSHTLQPFEIIDYQGERKFIIYSMGNFLSNQIYTLVHQPGDFGGLLDLQIEQIDEEKARLTSIEFMPTYCLARSDSHYILPVFDLPENFELSNYDNSRIEHFKTEILPRITSLMQAEYQEHNATIIYDLVE